MLKLCCYQRVFSSSGYGDPPGAYNSNLLWPLSAQCCAKSSDNFTLDEKPTSAFDKKNLEDKALNMKPMQVEHDEPLSENHKFENTNEKAPDGRQLQQQSASNAANEMGNDEPVTVLWYKLIQLQLPFSNTNSPPDFNEKSSNWLQMVIWRMIHDLIDNWSNECICYGTIQSLPLQSVMEVTNFCAAADTLIDQDIHNMEGNIYKIQGTGNAMQSKKVKVVWFEFLYLPSMWIFFEFTSV